MLMPKETEICCLAKRPVTWGRMHCVACRASSLISTNKFHSWPTPFRWALPLFMAFVLAFDSHSAFEQSQQRAGSGHNTLTHTSTLWCPRVFCLLQKPICCMQWSFFWVVIPITQSFLQGRWCRWQQHPFSSPKTSGISFFFWCLLHSDDKLQ